ncbi:Pr6Pr family membrane protein [soil metagenome]
MISPTWLFWRKGLAWAGVVIGIMALAVQFAVTLHFSIAAGRTIPGAIIFYFSFFTILCNIFCVACHAATVNHSPAIPWIWLRRPRVRGAAALYVLVGALVYIVVLQRFWGPQGMMRVLDIVLHYVTPVIFLVYWAAFVPKGRTAWTDALLWLIFPLAYLVYAMGRGMLTGLYPYPIIDGGALGLAVAMRNAAALAALFLVAGTLLIAIDKWLGHLHERH